MTQQLAKRVYWGATTLLSLLMIFSASADLVRFQPFVEDIRRLGYPEGILSILGVAKLLGVLALLYPGMRRLKEWAYAGFTFALGGAIISQVASGSTAMQILPAVFCASVLVVSYSAYRTGGRDSQPSNKARQ